MSFLKGEELGSVNIRSHSLMDPAESVQWRRTVGTGAFVLIDRSIVSKV